MRWLVADSLYNDEAYWCGHLNSWSHYLREAGETVIEMRITGPIDTNNFPEVDVMLVMDRYNDFAGAPYKKIAMVNTIPILQPWMMRAEDGRPAYDLILSAIPGLVAHARKQGCRAEEMHLAFDTRARTAGMGVERKAECITICGASLNAHAARIAMIDKLLPVGLLRVVEPTFGRAYFRALAGAAAIFNCHAGWAFGSCMNMRVYEATGMGAQLVTDGDPDGRWGDEIMRYEPGDFAQCAARIHEALIRAQTPALATKAYERCMAAHTYEHRIPRLVELARELMEAKR